MHFRGWAARVGVAGILAASGAAAWAKDPAPKPKPAAPAPVATQVVVRGQRTLASALAVCLGRATGPAAATAALVVIDATAGTKAAKAELSAALAGTASIPNRPTSWQAAALGGTPSAPVADPAALGPAIDAALAGATAASRDTLGLLRKTLKAAKSPTLVVYLAHAHFEDDVDLEGFVAEALAAKRTLCVIGPEAAFERPWSDVVAPSAQWRNGRRGLDTSVPGVGTRPFGPEDPAAPWHSGDTAAPILPWGFYDTWDLEFYPQDAKTAAWSRRLAERTSQPKRPPDPQADPDGFDRWVRVHVKPPARVAEAEAYRAWLEAVGPPPPADSDEATFERWFDGLTRSAPPAIDDLLDDLPDFSRSTPRERAPLPSSYPPYGLARACGVTGGCYVLWGWTTSDAAATKYDYARCGLFAPDLRSRGEILADYAKRPLARALLEAWRSLAQDAPTLVSRTPPVIVGAPSAIEYCSMSLPAIAFDTPAERDADVAEARASAAHLERVRVALAAEVDGVGEPKGDVDRRLRADADLLIHALASMRFQSAELAACAAAMPKSAWKLQKGKLPSVERDLFIDGDEDDLPVRVREAKPFDAAAGAALVAARKAFLERYRGTPFGAAVAKNDVHTYTSDVLDMRGAPVDLPKPGKGSSKGPDAPVTPPTPPAGGSSGSGGPTTGK